jgi:hypothetical protein
MLTNPMNQTFRMLDFLASPLSASAPRVGTGTGTGTGTEEGQGQGQGSSVALTWDMPAVASLLREVGIQDKYGRGYVKKRYKELGGQYVRAGGIRAFWDLEGSTYHQFKDDEVVYQAFDTYLYL